VESLTSDHVQRWLDDYVAAWRTYDPDAIGRLFTEDATYRYHPADPPLVGRDAIVASWRENPDPPGSWEADYAPWSVSADKAVATGTTVYANDDRYFNVFLLTFSEGRCCDFVEWFAQPRERA
jgi:ketosteroid isomerase-like protein